MTAATLHTAAVPPQSGPLCGLSAERVSTAHWEAMGHPGWPQRPARPLPGMLHWVAENHRCNGLLWAHQEQSGRASQRETVMALQQEIEAGNRQRNAALDALEEALSEALQGLASRADARAPGVTIGALADQLSINALKIYHLGLQQQRPDACVAQLGCCADKLAQLRVERAALMHKLDALLQGVATGALSYRIEHQFRAYRDPVLDACLDCARAAS